MKQTQKISNGGSIFNRMMGNNSTTPTVGEYVTILHYTDRTVAKVLEVSEDGKRVLIAACETLPAPGMNHDMGHQNWVHIESSYRYELIYKWGAWRKAYTQVVLDPKFRDKHEGDIVAIDRELRTIPGFFTEEGGWSVMKGYTKLNTRYKEVSVLWNECRYYYDWSF